jgi:hypothetical protein
MSLDMMLSGNKTRFIYPTICKNSTLCAKDSLAFYANHYTFNINMGSIDVVFYIYTISKSEILAYLKFHFVQLKLGLAKYGSFHV